MNERKIDWMSILVGILFILAAMASFRQLCVSFNDFGHVVSIDCRG